MQIILLPSWSAALTLRGAAILYKGAQGNASSSSGWIIAIMITLIYGVGEARRHQVLNRSVPFGVMLFAWRNGVNPGPDMRVLLGYEEL